MTTPGALAVHTVESTFIHPMCKPFDTPYQRIVGVEKADGDTVWVSQKSWDPHANFTPNDTEKVYLKSDPVLNERLAAFVETYMAKPEPKGAPYNCHRLAAWLTGNEVAASENGTRPPDNIVRFGSLATGGLKYGQHGAIGAKFKEEHPSTTHSIVGFAEPEQCIQVTAVQGHLALTSVEDVVDYYDHEIYQLRPEWSGYGLYTLPL